MNETSNANIPKNEKKHSLHFIEMPKLTNIRVNSEGNIKKGLASSFFKNYKANSNLLISHQENSFQMANKLELNNLKSNKQPNFVLQKEEKSSSTESSGSSIWINSDSNSDNLFEKKIINNCRNEVLEKNQNLSEGLFSPKEFSKKSSFSYNSKKSGESRDKKEKLLKSHGKSKFKLERDIERANIGSYYAMIDNILLF